MSEFPVDTFKDAAPLLRRPFAPGAVKWKINSTKDNGAQVVAYVDARSVIERLNLVVPHLWHTEFQRVDGNHVLCKLTIDGLTREDVGAPSKGGKADPLKTMYSDALKRAAVHFGVAVSIYAMRETWLAAGDGKGPELAKKGNSLVLTEDNRTYLANLYEQWLTIPDRGGKFGEPLDHGDDPEGSVGELADAEADVPAEDGPVMDEERAREQLAEIESLCAGNGSTKTTKGHVNAMIASAQSNADLDKILASLRGKEAARA